MPSSRFESLKKNTGKRITYNPDTQLCEISLDACFTTKTKCSTKDLNDAQAANYIDRYMTDTLGFYILEQFGISEKDLVKLDFVKDISISDLIEMIYEKEKKRHETLA